MWEFTQALLGLRSGRGVQQVLLKTNQFVEDRHTMMIPRCLIIARVEQVAKDWLTNGKIDYAKIKEDASNIHGTNRIFDLSGSSPLQLRKHWLF
jgi:hypothetical protein